MKRLWVKITFFIAGFTAVYVFLGVSVAFVGNLFKVNLSWFFIVAGLILVIFGLHVMRVFRIRWLEGQWGGMHRAKEAEDVVGSFLIGVAFAVGWSPCTGPIAAAILTLAANQGTVWAGGFLLLLYCLGLGIPFLLTGIAVDRFLKFFHRIQRYMRVVEIVSGILLIGMGILFLSQHSNLLRSLLGGSLGFSATNWETKAVGSVSESISIMAMAWALAAGFLSFISPCVLPLLPSYVAFIAGTDEIDDIIGVGESK